MSHYYVLIVSDGTGETGYMMLKAAMRQFEDVDILITRYANVRSSGQIVEILKAATRSSTLVIHTFASPKLRKVMSDTAKEEGAECIDVLGPLVNTLAGFFKSKPVAKPGLLHQVDEEYFERVDAIEFAIRHDDGESVADLERADIVLVGVSRTSKSPLSIYLAQEGWRVANIPVVVGTKLPRELFAIDSHKVIGLIIDPKRLAEARRVRLRQLGVDNSSYAELERIKEELKYARAIFEQNPDWPVIDVTGKSIEEVSQEVLDELIGRGRKM